MVHVTNDRAVAVDEDSGFQVRLHPSFIAPRSTSAFAWASEPWVPISTW
jgi:hypothetical protein